MSANLIVCYTVKLTYLGILERTMALSGETPFRVEPDWSCHINIKKSKTLLKTGIIGTVFAALCCFTPVLVILLGAVCLSYAVGYIDYVLLPVLAVFVGITIYAMVRKPGG